MKLFYLWLLVVPLYVLSHPSYELFKLNDPQEISVPKNFIWGTALSEYQVSGAHICKDSNWSNFESKLVEQSETACEFWHRYKEDIQEMAARGVQSLRFSIEWCLIEPEKGKFDLDAIAHYNDLINELLRAGITPMITLHHFVHPQWFEEMGGFEYEENNRYFERFAAYVFSAFSDRVQLWCTINEPTIFAFQGYVRGVFPPGKTNMLTAWKVLKNLIQLHCQTYRLLKALPHGNKAQIGLVHQYLSFESYTAYNPLEKMPGLLFNALLNQSVMTFLKTHVFSGLGGLIYYDASQEPIADFIGLNYYSRAMIKAQAVLTDPVIPSCADGEIMTDMPYAIYPQGFYDAIMDVAQCELPIYITENGIADAQDNRRDLWIRTYLGALNKAVADGADVRGFYYWSIMDNYEWDMGYEKKFGLYAVDMETKERTLRPGSQFYFDLLKQCQYPQGSGN